MGLSLIIKGLTPGLTERGKIKIGEKGKTVTSRGGKEFQPPQKLDHFRVVSLMRGPDGNFLRDEEVHRLYGDRPRVLPVRLLYDDIELNFQCRYTCFQGRTMWCYGDGETALRLNAKNERDTVACPCGRQDPAYQGQDRCKINSCLSVIIDGVERVGGVWKLRTTSYNTTVGILSSLALIKRLTGGVLAGLPLQLTLNPKTVISPVNGQAMQVWVVGIEYRGSIESLQQIAYDVAQRQALHQARIEQIEAEAKRLLSAPPVEPEEIDDVVEEFFPEQVEAAVKAEPEPKAHQHIQDAPDPEKDTPDPTDVNWEKTEYPKRSRRNRFAVDPAIFGKPEIITCGATPDQLLALRKLGQGNPEVKAAVKDLTGYDQLSYLREDEAAELIARFEADVVDVAPVDVAPAESDQEPPPQDPDERSEPEAITKVTCPQTGDIVYAEKVCLVPGGCKLRERTGYCPEIDGMPEIEEVI
jgi:hypothetical protein